MKSNFDDPIIDTEVKLLNEEQTGYALYAVTMEDGSIIVWQVEATIGCKEVSATKVFSSLLTELDKDIRERGMDKAYAYDVIIKSKMYLKNQMVPIYGYEDEI